jgi:hypothetical protein
MADARTASERIGVRPINHKTKGNRGSRHYVLAVKGNQPALQEAVQAVFDQACADDFAALRYDSQASIEDGHGRHEERYVTVI